LGRDYVLSNKPNPAFLAWDNFDDDAVGNDLRQTKDLARQYGCPLELIFKDISTVHYDPSRLTKIANIAMKIACD
jgi:hypothetical protein